MNSGLFLGIDIGTSGVRAIAIDAAETVRAETAKRFGDDARSPAVWLSTLASVLREIASQIEMAAIASVAVDGTSGTVLAIDQEGTPLAAPLMYDEAVSDPETLEALKAHGLGHLAGTGTARAFHLSRVAPYGRVVHQADWLSGLFSCRFDVSDDNNTLKTGFDPQARSWSSDVHSLGLTPYLPEEVFAPGASIGRARGLLAQELGLSEEAIVTAGTTDGCAAFLASGAKREGDCVTSLGSTLTLKLLSATRIEDRDSGVYSHRLLGQWLAGGASNSGGRVLAHYFDAEAISTLSEGQRSDPPTGLDYYPLVSPGERFPTCEPQMQPRLEPRPQDDAVFLKGMFEGMAEIEAAGYRRLAELGASPARRVFTVGGGAVNHLWREIRASRLNLPLERPASTEAAFGAALLARLGVQ